MDLRKQIIAALTLTAVLAVAAAAYFALNRGGDETNGEQTLGEAYSAELKDVQKAQFRYADPSLPDITLERTDNGWRLTEPIQAPAVQERVETLLRFLNQRIRKRVDGDMEQFGLTEPTVSAAVHTPSGAATFLFGRKSVSYGMYVKKEGESGAFIMEATILDDLLVSPSDLRDRRIMPMASEEAARVHIQRGGEPIVSVERGGPKADWRVVSPMKSKADPTAVQRFLEALLSLRAERFLPSIEEKTPSAWSAAVETFDGERRVLHMGPGEAEGWMLAVDERGYAYEASNALMERLPAAAFAWRNKRIADFQRTETTRVEVENRHGAFALERPSTAGNEWRLVQPTKRPADGKTISDLLFQLDSAQAVRILSEDGKDAAAYGFNKPRARLRFKNARGGGATIEIGADAEGGAAARSSRSPVVAAYRWVDLRGWMEGPAAFRDKRLLDYETKEARRLEIMNSAGSFVLTRGGLVAWRLEKPSSEAANTPAVEQINIGLRDLRAVRFYSSPPPVSETGLDRPRLTAAVSFGDGRKKTLHIGNEGPDGVYAQMKGDADVFAAPMEAFQLLNVKLDDLRPKP